MIPACVQDVRAIRGGEAARDGRACWRRQREEMRRKMRVEERLPGHEKRERERESVMPTNTHK